jgi:hypothetical protein
MHTLPNAGLTFIHTVWAADFNGSLTRGAG